MAGLLQFVSERIGTGKLKAHGSVPVEAPQPETCPKCRAEVWTFLEPYRVAHDVEKCSGK